MPVATNPTLFPDELRHPSALTCTGVPSEIVRNTPISPGLTGPLYVSSVERLADRSDIRMLRYPTRRSVAY